MKCQYKPQPITAIVLACFLTLSSGQAVATNFEPPKLDGFNLHAERDADGDKDGVNETHIRQYFNTSGDSIVSMTTKERIWAWSMDKRDNDSATKNYVIRDSDCDGVYDKIYSLEQEFHVPDCVKK